ncbi:MAG: hypothetical protein GY796_22995 [Chloroflexi bacterium]|nr:hypothetical protein [Chloroflexota bacterium]
MSDTNESTNVKIEIKAMLRHSLSEEAVAYLQEAGEWNTLVDTIAATAQKLVDNTDAPLYEATRMAVETWAG